MANTPKETSNLSSILSTPFKILNLPFKGYQQFFGKPKYGETYRGTGPQKTRLKGIMKSFFNCSEISKNDRFFMNMVNDFLTQEGQTPIDQHHPSFSEKCKDKDIIRYKYRKGFGFSYKNVSDNKNKKDKTKKTDSTFTKQKYFFNFSKDFDPKSKSGFKFKNNSAYGLYFIGKTVFKGEDGLEFSNNILKQKDESLIFITNLSNLFNQPIDFKVYLKDLKDINNDPTYLGQYVITINKIK